MADAPTPGPAAAPAAPSPASPAPAAPLAPSAPTPGVSGTAILAITTPFTTTRFISGVEGWDDITRNGTSGPAASAADVIKAGASCGVTVEEVK